MNRDDSQTLPPGSIAGDALLKRYHEASALDPARPSPALRAAVLAQARAAAAGWASASGKAPAQAQTSPEWIAESDHSTLGRGQNGSNFSASARRGSGSAANDSSWRLRAVASVTVIGLATLLFLQFERGTSDERDMAMGRTAPAAPTPPPAARNMAPAPSPGARPPEATAAPGRAETPQQPRQPRTPAPAIEQKAAAADTAQSRNTVSEVASLAAGRSADAASPGPEASLPTASQRLLAAVTNAALDAALQALNDGAPVNAPDAAGQTALMLAARRGDEAMVRLLLAAGADRTRTDPAGLTAAEHARRAGHGSLLPLLNPPESALPTPTTPAIPPAPQR